MLSEDIKFTPSAMIQLVEFQFENDEKLNDMSVILQEISKVFEEKIEQKRLAFPRFFFLSDIQFVDLLYEIQNGTSNIDKYISVLF